MYDWENDKALHEALEKNITFEGIEILICGQWIWVSSGNAYNYKKELKEIGFKWASAKKWYFHTDTFIKKMLMFGKEASNRKTEIDRQHHTIPNQRS